MNIRPELPELTQEQINHLKNLFDTNPQQAFIDCLSLADKKGWLNKWASLALKPDNWIEWGEVEQDKILVDRSVCMGFVYHTKQYLNIYFDPKEAYPYTSYHWCRSFKTLNEAKQDYQKWLDNYLKEQNNE